MEKKNINIWVVRTCTILLLTVFTIGRKYGEEQKAEKLINDLKQQPWTIRRRERTITKRQQSFRKRNKKKE